ncbi:MAG: glucosamine-6-phosphate deaminase [Acidobacteria bacterium]|nr:MAG: glucosamine-6-phosphate deaminase [Acidobacteriota bacterium]
MPPGPRGRRPRFEQHVRARAGAGARDPLRSAAPERARRREHPARHLRRSVKIEVFPTSAALARAVAQRLAKTLSKREGAVLLLPVGKTAVPVYREVVRMHAAGRVSFRRATTFNLDELQVRPTDPRSFRSFMEEHFFSKVDLPRDRIRFLRGDASDLEAECARYERRLARDGPPDVAFVGIGVNGHVAYLEPGRSLAPRTSPVRLSASTRRSLAADGLRPVPRGALTVGIETILSSDAIALVASGGRKAGAVALALAGRITPRRPASFLALHPRLEVFLDREAARDLSTTG